MQHISEVISLKCKWKPACSNQVVGRRQEEEYTLFLGLGRVRDATEFTDIMSCRERTLVGSSCIVRDPPFDATARDHNVLRDTDSFPTH